MVIFLEVEPWERDYLAACCPTFWQPVFYHEEADRIALENIRQATILSVFIYSDLDKRLLRQLPDLRMIATRSTGYDHIDMAFCRKQGIAVSNVPTYGANTVAEHTFALMLALSRKVVQACNRTTRADFTLEGLRGFDLMGKTLGVIGTGRIGRHVIQIAKGFQMQVLAYDVLPDQAVSDLLGFQYTSLDALLANADVITLHCPLGDENRQMIGKAAFERMKKGVLLINTARGGLINTDALLWALDEGIVAGAGLDVMEEEEAIREERELLSKRFDVGKLQAVIRNHVLLKHEQVIITPHIAFNSREAVERILQTTVENITKFFAGTPCNRVDL